MCSELLDVTHVTVGEAHLEEAELEDVLYSAVAALLHAASVAGVTIETDFCEGLRAAIDCDRLWCVGLDVRRGHSASCRAGTESSRSGSHLPGNRGSLPHLSSRGKRPHPRLADGRLTTEDIDPMDSRAGADGEVHLARTLERRTSMDAIAVGLKRLGKCDAIDIRPVQASQE